MLQVGNEYITQGGERVLVSGREADDVWIVKGKDCYYHVNNHGVAVALLRRDRDLVLTVERDCETCLDLKTPDRTGRCKDCRNFDNWHPITLAAINDQLDAALCKDTNPKDLIGVRKAPISVIPAGVLFDVGLAMHEGAVKYGRHNYRVHGVRASVYFDAGVGHMFDWWEGDDIDMDSGLSHVTKAIASLVVLRDAMMQGKLTDDRPPRSKVFKRDFNTLAGEIIDRHADKSPRHYTIADSHDALAFGPLEVSEQTR